MSKTATVFFTLLLVLASCFIAGCSSLPFSSDTPAPAQTPQKEAVSSVSPALVVTKSVSSERLELNNTIQQFFSTDVFDEQNKIGETGSQENAITEKKFKAIRGRDLDENGNARSWTFVIEHGDEFSVVTYSGKKVQVSNSPGTLTQSEILTDKVIMPRQLFDRNRAVIFNTTRTGTAVTRDLSIGEGRATLTITGSGGAPRILVFDATTGVLKSSND
jgi:hypothetical protein